MNDTLSRTDGQGPLGCRIRLVDAKVQPLAWLSETGNATYRQLLSEEITTNVAKRMMQDKSVSFTKLDLIWLQRVTASIDGDQPLFMEALELMLKSGHDLMQQSAEAELMVMNLPKESAAEIRRQFHLTHGGREDNSPD